MSWHFSSVCFFLLPCPAPPPTLLPHLRSFASPRHCPSFLQSHGFVSRLWFTTCSCAQFASFIGCVLFPKCHQNVDQCGPTSLLVHYWSAPFVHSRLLNNLSFFQTNDCLQLKITKGYFKQTRHYIHYTLSTLSSVEQFKLSPRHTTNNAQKHCWGKCP